MITYLEKNQDGATWLVAVATDRTAASIILESGQPVISMGGWSGTDNAMTLTKLKSLVESGQLHYIIVSSDGGKSTNSEITAWVEANGTAVNSSSYSSSSTTSSMSTSSGLYRLDASDVSWVNRPSPRGGPPGTPFRRPAPFSCPAPGGSGPFGHRVRCGSGGRS